MKRLISAILVVVMLLCCATPAFAQPGEGVTQRDTILMLDISDSMAGTPLTVMKEAAIKFCSQLLNTPDDNRIALVIWDYSYSTYSFSSDLDSVISTISNITLGRGTNTSQALSVANNLMTNSSRADAIKNIVLLTDGIPQHGTGTEDGPYVYEDTEYYRYANAAYNEAKKVTEKYNLYTFGFFHSLSQEKLQFAQRFLKDIQNAGYYEVTDPDKLEFVFGQVAEDLLDTDGDGLPDQWEIEGVTIDGEFVDLPEMGADPTTPDIFVEIDWMVQPESTFLWFQIEPETSLAPSQAAMRIVYNAFLDHGIHLHIDAGPDSTDFVTGRTWGALSGGNVIPYEKHFPVNGDKHAHWKAVAEANFSASRSSIFKYCLFINKYDQTSSSGIANDIPGQYFIVANQEWVRKTGDTGIAGTFMHELGHTLGLCHGGHTATGEGDHTQYKPNYLSIMNYLFQTSGLVGTNEINYSEYDLPDLDESALDEFAGIDPERLTAGTGLGTKFKNNTILQPIAGVAVDFNRNGSFSTAVSCDINADKKIGTLTSSNDWEHIVFKGGNIGKDYAFIAGISDPEAEEVWLEEPMLEEFIEAGVLGNKGAGSVTCLGPVTVISGLSGQALRLRVNNLSPEEATFVLDVKPNQIIDAFSKEISVPAAIDDIGFIDVDVPLVDRPAVGEYSAEVSLSYLNSAVFEGEFLLPVYAPSEEELQELADALDSGELDELLPQEVIDNYIDILNSDPCIGATSHLEHKDPTCTEAGYDRTICDNCGEVLSEEIIPALGHDIVADKAVAATCTEPGLTAGEHCTRCSYKIEQKAVDPLGHNFRNGVCTRCGAKDPSYQSAPCDGGRDCPSYAFRDVNRGDWFHEAVDFAVENGLFNGMSSIRFEPNTPMTRAMLVTVLWRYEGSPRGGSTTFRDVPSGQWYTEAVSWAAANGIVDGVGNNRFEPNGSITREQLAAILFRYSQSKGYDTSERGSFAGFPDTNKISRWASDSYSWAVGEKLITGNVIRGVSYLDPQGHATRAQVATILMRYILAEHKTDSYDTKGHTYRFVFGMYSWAEAQAKASSEGGYLARIDDADEYRFVTSMLSKNGYHDTAFFIGARRFLPNTDYFFVDRDDNIVSGKLNTASSWASAYWLSGEPTFRYDGVEEWIVAIEYKTAEGRWLLNDIPDNASYPADPNCHGFIIEYEP